MPNNMSEELDALIAMKPPELRARWRDVYRSIAPDIGPDLLRRGIAYRIQERRQGSLASSTRRDVERLIKQIAQDITGAHWSGPRFFGLATRRKLTLSKPGDKA